VPKSPQDHTPLGAEGGLLHVATHPHKLGKSARPKIKKAGGISRFLDAFFYRNSITENQRSVELTGLTVVGLFWNWQLFISAFCDVPCA